MKHDRLDVIKATRKTCYFISPHYDDMVFSASALALELKKTNRIVVINIFTEAGYPHTLSAKAYLRQCDYSDAKKLYMDREEEDKAALQDLADEVIDLGFSEALWRKKTGRLSMLLGKLVPECNAVYPTYRFNVVKGMIAKADRQLVTDIDKKLKDLIQEEDAIVFCPLGIGGHVDHVITHDVCKELFPEPIYWADYPYLLTDEGSAPGVEELFEFTRNKESKSGLVRGYKTQYRAMFGTDEPRLEPERFFISQT